MCGIAGYVDFSAGGPSPAILHAMTNALARRGPDAQATLVEGPCGLAHARLSIIDIDGSPQPMAPPDSDLAMVYNGETYNYLQLRRELQGLGQSLTTNGDGEAVLRWVEREWEKALPRFDAMFAFGVWDRKRQRLLLGRDALGEKPLFYATPAPGVLVFGSEVKALLNHPAVDRGLDEDALRQALRFRAVYGTGCLHRGVSQVEPGTWLEFSRAGVRTGRFHDLLAETDAMRREIAGQSEAQLIAYGRHLFMESVSERLIADVPVGAFLSGGLDSSLIVAAMRQVRAEGAEIRTFSVGFKDDPHSELPHAQSVADAIGTTHMPLMVGPESYVARLSELSACRDGPVSQPADVAIAEMSHQARKWVKVALSGEGADEIFGGYPKYAFANAPWAARRGAALFGPERGARLAGALGVDRRRALVALRALAGRREVDRLVQWFSYFDRADLQALMPGLGWTDADWDQTISDQSETLSRIGKASPLFRMQATDCLTWLPGNMLERGDRMTMAEGLEVRPPFLDKELAAFGLALPDRMKVRGGTGKWIVRQWAADMIPPTIAKRPKWGFRVPLAQWFRGPMRDMLHAYLTSPHGLSGAYGDIARVRTLLQRHDEGTVDASESLWTLLSAEVWYQDVFQARRGGDAVRAVA